MPDFVLKAEVDLLFIRAGVASKTGKPYASFSNGLTTFFVTLAKGFDITELEKFSEGDTVACQIEQRVGSDNVTLIKLLD